MRAAMSRAGRSCSWRLLVGGLTAVGIASAAHGKNCEAVECFAEVAEHMRFASSLAVPPCRDDFATMAQRHFFRTGRAAEVGVYQGMFAGKNIRKWLGHYYAIDAWAWRPADPADKNYRNESRNMEVMAKAKGVIDRAVNGDTSRYTMVRALSADAASQFPDGYFDWLYIDALHTHDALTQDLHAWWPKLREGGLLSGDDYGDMTDTEYITKKRYQTKILAPSTTADGNTTHAGLTPYASKNSWGVISALQDFARTHFATVHVTWSLDCYAWPAWWIVKPPNCLADSS